MQLLTTERLLLRPFTLADAEDLHREVYGDAEVLRYYSGGGLKSLEEVRRMLVDKAAVWAESDLGRLAVFRKDDGAFLGQVHLDAYVNAWYRWAAEPNSPFNPVEVELAFAFGKRWWGQSFAFEACGAMIRYAFDDLKLPRLVGGADENNLRSVNLQRRLGYNVFPHTSGQGFVTVLENRRHENGYSQA